MTLVKACSLTCVTSHRHGVAKLPYAFLYQALVGGDPEADKELCARAMGAVYSAHAATIGVQLSCASTARLGWKAKYVLQALTASGRTPKPVQTVSVNCCRGSAF